MKITLETPDILATIEPTTVKYTLTDVIDDLVIPVLVAVGYSEELVRSHIDPNYEDTRVK